MKNRISLRALFTFILFACLFVSKGFSCTYASSEPTYEMPFVKMTEDKHYVKPGSIVFSADGLFLAMQGHLIPINCVEKDAGGVFIRPQAYELERCPSCRYPLTPGGTCLNPRCPLSPLHDPDYD